MPNSLLKYTENDKRISKSFKFIGLRGKGVGLESRNNVDSAGLVEDVHENQIQSG